MGSVVPPLEKNCPWRNLALLDIIKSNEVKIKKVRLQNEYQKSNSFTTDLKFALCGTKSSFLGEALTIGSKLSEERTDHSCLGPHPACTREKQKSARVSSL